jgi:hypothetical protein
MTASELSRRIGVPRRTIYRYKKDNPAKAPRSFDDIEGWLEFVLAIKNYPSDRTTPSDQKEAEPVVPSSANSAKNGDGEYTALEERKQRIIKLRLNNDCRRAELAVLRRESIPVSECLESFAMVASRTRAELLEIPGSLAETLSGKDPTFIQVVLEKAIAKSLEALSRPEAYFKTETERGANGVGPVSGG